MDENLFLKQLSGGFTHGDIVAMSALNLAYIGDAVFEMLVRTRILRKGKVSPNTLHNAAKGYVNAGSQAEMYHRLESELSDEELNVMRRGRNAKSQSKAKNATVNDYRHATGIEALFGYLYLKNDIDRIMQLFEICAEGY